MTALYVLSNTYLALAEKLADGDFDAQTVTDTIEASGITDELAVKAQGIEFVARSAEQHHATIDAEIARLQTLKAHRSKIAENLRAYLLDNMQRTGIEKLDCPLFSISIRKNPPSVEIISQHELPAKYMVTPEPVPPVAKPDKKAIGIALKAGEDVPGAKLVQGVRLNIA